MTERMISGAINQDGEGGGGETLRGRGGPSPVRTRCL